MTRRILFSARKGTLSPNEVTSINPLSFYGIQLDRHPPNWRLSIFLTFFFFFNRYVFSTMKSTNSPHTITIFPPSATLLLKLPSPNIVGGSRFLCFNGGTAEFFFMDWTSPLVMGPPFFAPFSPFRSFQHYGFGGLWRKRSLSSLSLLVRGDCNRFFLSFYIRTLLI